MSDSKNAEELVVYNIMRDEGGREFMWKHLQMCGVFETMFDHNPIKQGFNAGRQSAGFNLSNDLKEYAPDYYLKMLKENM